MYPNYLQQANGALPTTLDMPAPGFMGDVARQIDNGSGRLASLYGDALYDHFRLVEGVLPANEWDLFTIPMGQDARALNGSTPYRKTRAETNMTSAGQLPGGQEFWAVNWQAVITISGLKDDTANADGSVSVPGAESAVVSADAINATNLMAAVQKNMTMTVVINGVEFETGNLSMFPARCGISGFASGVTYVPAAAGTTIAINETGVNNGFGVPREFPIVRHIPSLISFGVKLRNHRDMTISRIVDGYILAEGIRAKSITG